MVASMAANGEAEEPVSVILDWGENTVVHEGVLLTLVSISMLMNP